MSHNTTDNSVSLRGSPYVRWGTVGPRAVALAMLFLMACGQDATGACEECMVRQAQPLLDCDQSPPPPGCYQEEPPDPPPAPAIPNSSFNQIQPSSIFGGIPDDWLSNCSWGFNIYAAGYGETGSGTVLFPTAGCSIFSRVAPAPSGAHTYSIRLRHRTDPSRQTAPCGNCALVTATWFRTGGSTVETTAYLQRSSAWTTTIFSTTKPADATGLRIEIASISQPGDDVYIDWLSVE
jgi:hypothetical protein